jgi:CRP-like cAMP-binding protein
MLQDILTSLGKFTPANCRIFEKYLVPKQLVKNEILLREGEICQAIYYLVSGAVYEYNDSDIDENIIDLHTGPTWFLQYESFTAQKPCRNNLKAYTPCAVLVLPVTALHQLIALSPAFLQMGKILEKGLARMHYFDNALTPLQKYQHLLQTRPELLQVFPLKFIASYLKITPETLSRVRNIY